MQRFVAMQLTLGLATSATSRKVHLIELCVCINPNNYCAPTVLLRHDTYSRIVDALVLTGNSGPWIKHALVWMFVALIRLHFEFAAALLRATAMPDGPHTNAKTRSVSAFEFMVAQIRRIHEPLPPAAARALCPHMLRRFQCLCSFARQRYEAHRHCLNGQANTHATTYAAFTEYLPSIQLHVCPNPTN